MQRTPLLPSLLRPPWPRVVAPDCQSLVLKSSSRVELRMKANSHLSIRKGRLYAHRGIPPCAGGLLHSQCVDWL